jgi:hypothetical protein
VGLENQGRRSTPNDRQTGSAGAHVGEANAVTETLWIIIAAAAVVVVAYLLVMRVFFRQSREIDQKTDFSKIPPLKDDDDR